MNVIMTSLVPGVISWLPNLCVYDYVNAGFYGIFITKTVQKGASCTHPACILTRAPVSLNMTLSRDQYEASLGALQSKCRLGISYEWQYAVKSDRGDLHYS